MTLLKKTAADVKLQPITEGVFAGSQICEVFDTSGNTEMACGVHEIGSSVTVVEKAPVDDVLFILEGEMQVESGGDVQTYKAGDFAYLRSGYRQVFTVADRVKHVYVCHPGNWKA